MPEKTIREMSAIEIKRHSLEAKTFRATLVSCIVLGLVLLIVGLGLYGFSLTTQYANHAFYLSQNAAMSATHGTDAVTFAKNVMDKYKSLDDDIKAKTGTTEYRKIFSEFESEEAYNTLINMLPTFSRSGDVSDVYLAMYDEDACAMVYIVDPDETDRLYPGEWENADEKGIRKFLDWNGEGALYDIEHLEKYGWICTAGTPIRDENGNICAFLLVDVTIDNVFAGMRTYTVQVTAMMVLMMVLLAFFMIRHMKKTLVNPINEITEAAQSYAKDRRTGVRNSKHFEMLKIRTKDEVENLSLVMADMEKDLLAYEKNLTKITAEKERISTELNLATRIQADMLPNIYPAFPDRKEFDIYAKMEPAKEVGGDFYDFFLIDDDHLCMVMADVSEKGVPAALFMMASKIILANNAMMGKSPAQILTDTNTSICANNREEMFVTVWLGIFEISTGKLTYANAGHEYPILKTANGNFELLKDKHGFVIGELSGIKYKQYELILEKGSKLFLYTDGVTEATDKNGNMFGKEKLIDSLNKDLTASPEQTLKNVRAAVDNFIKDVEKFDDLTMLCMEYKGTDEKNNASNSLTVDAVTDNLPKVTDFVHSFLDDLSCSQKTLMQIDLAIEEIFVNISSYAYDTGIGKASVSVELSDNPSSLIMTFSDGGTPYNPLEKEDPDTTLSLEEREIGGFGIFMTKKVMDNISYEYKDGQNILRLTKNL